MKTSQTLYQVKNIPPPAGRTRWSPMRAREELSSRPHTHAALFHHSEGGSTIQAPSSIRFRGGRYGFGVVVVSDIPEDLQAELIRTLLAYALDNGGEFDVKTLKCGIEQGSAMISYSTTIVIGRRDKKIKPTATRSGRVKNRRAFNDKIRNDEIFRDEQLRWEIIKGISRQSQRLLAEGKLSLRDVNFLGRVEEGVLLRETADEIMDQITIKKIESMSPAKRCLPRYYVEFDMPINLFGDWAAGHMNHKGYGRLIKKRGAMS